jgi:hypothetical protein
MEEPMHPVQRSDSDATQSATEPEQAKEGQEKAAPKKYDEDFELLVAALFAQYDSQTEVEDEAIVRMAAAMWKKKDQSGSTAGSNHDVDQQIVMALARLAKSKALRRSCNLTTDEISTRGTIRTNRIAKMRSRPTGKAREAPKRCWRKALEAWTRPGEGGSPPAPAAQSPSVKILREYARMRGITLR